MRSTRSTTELHPLPKLLLEVLQEISHRILWARLPTRCVCCFSSTVCRSRICDCFKIEKARELWVILILYQIKLEVERKILRTCVRKLTNFSLDKTLLAICCLLHRNVKGKILMGKPQVKIKTPGNSFSDSFPTVYSSLLHPDGK